MGQAGKTGEDRLESNLKLKVYNYGSNMWKRWNNRAGPAAPIPEPGTVLLLLGSGLAGLDGLGEEEVLQIKSLRDFMKRDYVTYLGLWGLLGSLGCLSSLRHKSCKP